MDKTREEKIEMLRKCVNSDEWMEKMTDDDVDEVVKAMSLPVKRLVTKMWNIVKDII